MIRARLKRFFHCLLSCYRMDSCRAITIWNESFGLKRETLVIGCDCGKIFYSKDEESTAMFKRFIEE